MSYASDDVKTLGLSPNDLQFDDCPSDALTLSLLQAKSLKAHFSSQVTDRLKHSNALIITHLNAHQAQAQLQALQEKLNITPWPHKFSRPVHGYVSALIWQSPQFNALGAFNQSSGKDPDVWVVLAQGNGQSITLVTTITGHYSPQLLLKQNILKERQQVILAGQLSQKIIKGTGYQRQQSQSNESLFSRGLPICASGHIPLANHQSLLWLNITH
ncbi:hypothetical protein [Celerinatantimonas yamalensis]|uniref:Uncharacterized protein n=1 Tax=Celerinatantimonas yamalensis TaxID=559956 RepID=A0ABW9GB47_9GAMM